MGEGKPAAGVEQGAAAPWPELAGARGVRDLGHEKENRRHRGVVELKANSPRASTSSGRSSGGPATEEGGRRPCKIVRRSLGKHRELERTKGELRRLRKPKPKLGKLLARLGTHCSGGLKMWRISAAALANSARWL